MIRIGVIGCGHLGGIHIKLLNASKNFDLIGFFDNDDKRATEIRQQYNIRRFEDINEMSNQINAVIIATPTTSHYSLAKFFLQQKKHVFIEKPITSTIQEAKELTLLVDEFGLVGQVGHVERFNSAFSNVKKIINPMFIEAHRLSHYPERGTDVSVVLDLMIHEKVNANGTKVISDSPDIVNARIEFENGCVANLTASRISLKKMRKMRIFQPDSYISINFDEGKSEQVKIVDYDRKNKYSLTLRNSEGILKEIRIVNYDKKDTNAIEEEHNNFFNSIKNKTKPDVCFKSGLEALKVAFLILNDMKND